MLQRSMESSQAAKAIRLREIRQVRSELHLRSWESTWETNECEQKCCDGDDLGAASTQHDKGRTASFLPTPACRPRETETRW